MNTKLPVFLICGKAGVGKDTVGGIIKERLGFTTFAQADPIKEIGKKVFGFTDDQLWGPSANRNVVDPRFAPGTKELAAIKASSTAQHDKGSYEDWKFLLDLQSSFIAHTDVKVHGHHEVGRLEKLLKTFCAAMTAFAESSGGLTPRIVLQLLGTEVGRAYESNVWVAKAISRTNAELLDTAPGVCVTDGRFRNEIVGFRSYGGYAIKVVGETTTGGSTHKSEAELDTIPDHFYDAILTNNKADGMDALRFAVMETVKPWLQPRQIRTYA